MYESVNYGIRNYSSHSHKMQTKLYKILKFGVNSPKVSKIIYKEMYGHSGPVRDGVRMPYISLLILKFLNHCISVKTCLISYTLYVISLPTGDMNSIN